MPIQARRWDAEDGLASVVLHGECDAARRGGCFLGETLSWLERSPSMLRQ
jgi:hypothetical protein